MMNTLLDEILSSLLEKSLVRFYDLMMTALAVSPEISVTIASASRHDKGLFYFSSSIPGELESVDFNILGVKSDISICISANIHLRTECVEKLEVFELTESDFEQIDEVLDSYFIGLNEKITNMLLSKNQSIISVKRQYSPPELGDAFILSYEKILPRIFLLKRELSKFPSIIRIDIICRSKSYGNSFMLDIMLDPGIVKQYIDKDEIVDTIDFEIIIKREGLSIFSSAELCFGDGEFFEKFHKIELTSPASEKFDDALDYYFFNIKDKIERMISMITV